MARKFVEVGIGYAASSAGDGVAYASLVDTGGQCVLRLPFRIARRLTPFDRAVSYAALVTVARALRKRGICAVRFSVPDAQFAQEITARSEVPETLALAYVRLRCALNALDAFEIVAGGNDDLTQRARAEVALNLAA